MVLTKRMFFENELTESIGKPKDIWKTLRWLADLLHVNLVLWKKKKNAVEHVNSVLEGFRDHYSTLLEKLVKVLPGPPNKYPLTQLLNIMDMWSKNSILTIPKATQVSKPVGIDNLSGAKILSKRISDLYNISITFEKIPDSCKVAEIKPVYKKGFLTQPSNYKPISSLLLTVV